MLGGSADDSASLGGRDDSLPPSPLLHSGADMSPVEVDDDTVMDFA